MGTDIASFAEVRGGDGEWSVVDVVFTPYLGDECGEPFGWRDYGLFAWLADVRNYSAIEPIHDPKGLPHDVSPELAEKADYDGIFHRSWLTVAELQAQDYEAEINDRRIESDEDGELTGAPEAGERMSLRRFLGQRYFEHLNALASLGKPEDVRIVFWFV